MSTANQTNESRAGFNTLFCAILFTVIAYVLANFPLVYSLIYVHRKAGIAELWGYSPHQFFFLVFIFPLSAFVTFLGLHLMVKRIGPIIPDAFAIKWAFDNWVILLLFGLCLASMITIVDYFCSARSIDKLTPAYARRTLDAVQKVTESINAYKKEERNDERERLIAEAIKAKETLTPPPQDTPGAVARWLDTLPPPVVLQVVMDAGQQRRLHLLDSTLYPLNVLQVLIGLFVGISTFIMAVGVIYIMSVLNATARTSIEFDRVANAAFYAVFFFGFYVICYQQYLSEIATVAGSRFSSKPQVAVGLFVITLMILLTVLDPSKSNLPRFILLRIFPLIAMLSAIIVEWSGPQLLRQFIGIEVNFATQIFLIIFVWACTLYPLFHIWPSN